MSWASFVKPLEAAFRLARGPEGALILTWLKVFSIQDGHLSCGVGKDIKKASLGAVI